MKFLVRKTSDFFNKDLSKEIEFSCLEEFVAWVKHICATTEGCRGIVFDGEEIEIYDDYRE